MSDAVNTEPQTSLGGVSAAGQNFHRAVHAGENGRRISADSFRSLTARLKAGKPAAERPLPIVPDLLAGLDNAVPVAAPEVAVSRPDLDFAAFPPVSQYLPPLAEGREPETPAALPQPEAPEAVLPLADDFAEAAAAPLPSVALPAFEPLHWRSEEHEQSSAPETAAAEVTETDATAAGREESEDAHSALAGAVELPEFHPVEFHEAPVPPQPDPVAQDAAEEVAFAAEAQPPQPVLDAELHGPELAGDADGVETDSSQPLEESPQDLAPHSEAAALASAPDEDAAHPLPEAALPEIEEEPAALAPVEAEPEAAAPEPYASELDADSPAPEPKAPASEMAGRVVDAMLKTISTAIYAKPSSAERAAFLREVAQLMQEAAGGAAEAPPRAAEAVADLPGPPAPMPVPVKEPASVAQALAERIGANVSPLLKQAKDPSADPFSSSSLPSRLVEPKPIETVNADEESGELAMTLLDMMSGGTGSLPHERTLAADTMLRILPRIPVKQLLSVVERVSIMETPPPLLVAKLIRDTRAEIVAPLLERCSHISDQDLMNAAPDGDAPKLRMIARRRSLSTMLSDHLIATGEPGVLLTLIRNPGAALSHDAFFRLAEFAAHNHGLLAPLTTRADLPPPVAFELFWHVPPELRRFIFSRFLTDSETLNKILRITLSTHENDAGDAMGEARFPSRDAVETAIGQVAAFKIEDAAKAFAEMASIDRATATRILSDADGEPVTVLLKALGCTRARFEEALTRLRLSEAGVLKQDRSPDELQAIFDGLSFNKARILVTYWDWYMRKAGPYAPHN